jgi:predicted metal-dependent peptidase
MSAAAELTPDTEQHLRKRLAASQIRMSERHPFFGALLMLAPVELTDTVPTAATDGRQLLFNPAFLQGLSTAELDGLVIHELLHCAFLHVPRRRDRDATLWNVACDIHINGLIRTLEGLSLPKGGVEDPKLAHLSVEEIYAALLQSGKVRKLALADLLDGTMDAAAAEQLSAHWSDAMHRAVAAAQMHGFGAVPEAILRAVQETHAPQLDWRSTLWRHVVRTPDDFAGFDRRHVWQGLYVETLEGETLEVDVCIDTSGSVTEEQLSRFLAELRGIVRAYPVVRCQLYYADAACAGPFEVDADRPFAVAAGGGGTDFRPFFTASAESAENYQQRSGRTRLAVYLTDGHGTFPQPAPPREVLWVVTPGGLESKHFPFGIVVRMRETP